MLVMHYPHVTLVTEQRRIDGLLNDGVAVWIVTFSALPSLLWTEWVSVPRAEGELCLTG